MTQSNVYINLIAAFKGGQNIDQASQKLGNFDSAVSKLGKKLGAVFAADKIIAFGKASVQAFTEDQKAATLLANTLKNVGQGFQDANVEKLISTIQSKTGVLDDTLRASFSTLVLATKDTTKAQDLLNTALDVSAGTGKDLQTVTLAISKAYLGNTTALSRLGVGLTNVQLKGKSWAQAQKMLNNMFKGDAAAAAETYAGKIDRIKAAYGEAQETIGKGLVTAFTDLTANGDVQSFTDNMGKAATYISDIITGIGVIGEKLVSAGKAANKYYDFSKIFNTKNIPVIGAWLQILSQTGKKAREAMATATQSHGAPGAMATLKAAQQAAYDQAKADRAAAAAAALLNKQKSDQLKLQKAQLALKQASKVLDLQAIEIAAALQNNSLSDKDRTALLLQQAILNENADAATALANNLKGMKDELATPIPDPFKPFVDGANAATDAVNKLIDAKEKAAKPVTSGGYNDATPTNTSDRNVENQTAGTGSTPSGTQLAQIPSTGTGVVAGTIDQQGPIIYITPAFQFNIDGSVVTDAVTLAQIQNTAAGVSGSYNRSQTFIY